MTTNTNLKVFARLRPPLQHEIYSSNTSFSKEGEKKGRPSTSSKSSSQNITYPKQSSLVQDFLYSFYAPETENNQKLIYLKNPVKGKQLEKTLKNDNDFETVHDLLPDISAVFEFDKVFGPNIRYQAFKSDSNQIAIAPFTSRHARN